MRNLLMRINMFVFVFFPVMKCVFVDWGEGKAETYFSKT